MNALSAVSPPVTPTACYQHHQYWQQLVHQQAIEIQQLGSLLLEVTNLNNCHGFYRSFHHSLHHDAMDYYRDLNQLQSKLDRLTHDLICEGTDCSQLCKQFSCGNIRSDQSATLERHVTGLISEFSRIREGCLQFLSSMMSLNLL